MEQRWLVSMLLIASVYQDVKDRILPLENVMYFRKTKNIPSYNRGL